MSGSRGADQGHSPLPPPATTRGGPLTAVELAAVGAVALVAGAVNAVAGGGSLVLFPALLATGLPPLAANVTNTVALWPGYAGACAGYRDELRGQRPQVLALGATVLAGGAMGSGLLLLGDDRVFDAVVPFLVLAAGLLLAVQPRLAAVVLRLPGGRGGLRSPLLHLALLAAGAYGGYFGGALGVVLLAVLAIILGGSLQRLNALRSVLALLVNTVALMVFALLGPVQWAAVAVAAPAALAGGYGGARVARRLPVPLLRALVVGLAVVVGLVLLL